MSPRLVSCEADERGHLEELRTDPIGLLNRVRQECGDVGAFQLADRRVILLSGSQANEFFFRSSDEDLDQGEAYPFRKPIFGEGVVFDDFAAAGNQGRGRGARPPDLQGRSGGGDARDLEPDS